jgi:hypothetical protein
MLYVSMGDFNCDIYVRVQSIYIYIYQFFRAYTNFLDVDKGRRAVWKKSPLGISSSRRRWGY